MSALELHDLRVSRGGREVVHGINLTVTAGEVTALLGANGAGKSSTVLAVAGLERTTSGRVVVDGTDLRGSAPGKVRAAGIATVQEGHRVFADISVADNLRIASLALPRTERAAAIERTYDTFDELRKLGDRDGGALSGGQQQMLALASALVAPPRYLVVDEMSLGLAPVVVARLVPALRAIAASGVGVLLIEQFTQVALELASTVTVLAQGRVTLQTTAESLQADPDPLAEAYRITTHE